MEYKKNPKTKHFYTFSDEGWIKKSKKSRLFLYYELIEKTLAEFPENIEDKSIEVIRKFLNSMYTLFWDLKNFDSFLKATVYLEKSAEDLEREMKPELRSFIDFSRISNKRIRELNNLRVNLRVLENMFWIAVKDVKRSKLDSGELLVIPHFLNVASKYVFYYIVKELENLENLQNFEYNSKSTIEYFNNLEIDIELFEKYYQTYKKVSLKDYF